ncbi:MAG: hypothetical protein V4678_03120 [Patescibacteria group bacterium]
MEREFPLAAHRQAARIKQFVMDSLFGENADPAVSRWSDDAVIYTRSSWTSISERLTDNRIDLTSEEEIALIDFSSEYASLVDDEDDTAEIIQLRKQGENDE